MATFADGWNSFWGSVTFWDNENGDAAAVRGRLEQLGDRPYAVAALARLNELNEGGFDLATEGQALQQTFMTGLRDHLRTIADPAARFTEFKTALNTFSGGESGSALSAFDEAPENVQQALMHAFTNNPGFLAYIQQNSEGPLATMLSPENLRDPQFAGPISDILNTIGNNPNTVNADGTVNSDGYDFTKLDTLGSAAADYFNEMKKPEAERRDMDARFRAMLDATRAAGGNIPAMANLNGEMLLQFLNDLFNGDAEMAISNLAGGLGLAGQDLEDFNQLMRPLAGIMQFMGQDYYDFAQMHGPTLFNGVGGVINTVGNLTQGRRVEAIDSGSPASGIDGAGGAEVIAPVGGSAIREEADASEHLPESVITTAYANVGFHSPIVVSGKGLDGVPTLRSGNANAVIAGEENPGYREDTLVAEAGLGRTRTFESAGLHVG